MTGTEWALLGGVIIVGAIVGVLINRRGASARGTQMVLSARGAMRCQAAADLLAQLHRQDDIAACWEQIEIPLLEALPDCPPPFKAELIAVLDACASRCTKRELAKRIVTMRNALLN